MKLKEIEMDLPYKRNEEYIALIQKKEDLSYEEAVKKDYDVNWKELRKKFQLSTRCMTSMIERIMEPINNSDCSKIIFECADNCNNTDYRSCLGISVVRIDFDIQKYLETSDLEKKEMIIDAIIQGINILSYQAPYDTTNLREACLQIKKEKYVNEWIWKKSLITKDVVVQINIKHEIEKLDIYMLFIDKAGKVKKEILLVSTSTDERIYDMYLGKLEQISENEIALITKNGQKYVQVCE